MSYEDAKREVAKEVEELSGNDAKKTQSKYSPNKKAGGGNILKTCDGCSRQVRRHRTDKKSGKILCFRCYRNTVTIMPTRMKEDG